MTFGILRFRYQSTEGADGISRRAWRTGFWRRAPMSGVLALITAILCGIATIAVLRASDGLPINSWHIAGYTVQPTVLLSIFATLANALFRYAFTEGAKVSWWVQAQHGASIGALHRSWDHAQSALPITTAGRDVTFNAVASFFVLMLLIDGPFFQRASSIGVITRHHSTQVKVNVSPSPFMLGATGIFADHDNWDAPTLLNPVYSEILQQYNNREALKLPEFGCKGRCELELTAPGWDIECERWTSPYHLMDTADWERWDQAYWHNQSYSGPANFQTMFWSNVTYDVAASDMWYRLYRYRNGSLPPGVSNNSYSFYPEAFPFNTILLSSMRKSTTDRNGTLAWRCCILREAVQRYPVIVTNTTVTIPRRNTEQSLTVYKVIRQGETSAQGGWPSTLGGLWLSLSQAFSGSATLEHVGFWEAVRTNSSSGQVYIDVANATMLNTLDVMWTDPIDDMISMIQELSLRTAIRTTSVPPQNPAMSTGFAPPEPEQIKDKQAELTAAQSVKEARMFYRLDY